MRVRIFRHQEPDGTWTTWRIHWATPGDRWWRTHVRAEHVRLRDVDWVVRRGVHAYAEGEFVSGAGIPGRCPTGLQRPISTKTIREPRYVSYVHGVDEEFQQDLGLGGLGMPIHRSKVAEFLPDSTAWAGESFAQSPDPG